MARIFSIRTSRNIHQLSVGYAVTNELARAHTENLAGVLPQIALVREAEHLASLA